jgi:hypothetical protein
MEKQMKTLIYVFGGLAILLVLGAIYMTQFIESPENQNRVVEKVTYTSIEQRFDA